MKVFPAMRLCRRSNSKSRVSGFTLTELLFTVVLLVMVALVVSPVLLRDRESSLLAACTSNLRQIGTGCGVYASENNDYLPTVDLGSSGNAFSTYIACFVTGVPSKQISGGPYSFGQLYFYGGVNNPQVFYCPAAQGDTFAFHSYSAPGYPWPAITTSELGPNPFVRCGYEYYPQSKILTQNISLPGGNLTLPAYNFVTVNFNPPNPPGGTPSSGFDPTPLTLSQVNLKKAMVVDNLTTWAGINHKYRGQPYGENTLFPDGHVRFQSIWGNNKKNSYAPFDQSDLWDPAIPSGPGETAYGSSIPAFRVIMNGFQP